MSKTDLTNKLADLSGLTKVECKGVLDHLTEVITAALKADGNFTLPNLLKITLRDVPARAAGEMMSPLLKKMIQVKAKPASKKVVVRVLKSLKASVG